jgi:DNA-binding NarL/FixJ family response regulator
VAKSISTTMNPRPRVLLADDHTLLLDAFQRLLEPVCDIVGTASDGRTLVELAIRTNPEIVIQDIAMPHLNGIEAAAQIRRKLPAVKIIFLTVNHDPDIAAEAIRLGASAFLLKSSASAELISAITLALAGKTYITPLITKGRPLGVFLDEAGRPCAEKLTARQREVLQLLAEGKQMKEAAAILKLTPRTIAFHKYEIMEQLGLKTGAELVQYAVEHQIVSPRT